MLQNEQNLSVVIWRHAEQKHDFIQAPDLRTRRIVSAGPGIRLTFHQYRRVFAAKVKFVRFLDSDSYWRGESGLKDDASFGEEEPSRLLKFSAYMRIADRAAENCSLFSGSLLRSGSSFSRS